MPGLDERMGFHHHNCLSSRVQWSYTSYRHMIIGVGPCMASRLKLARKVVQCFKDWALKLNHRAEHIGEARKRCLTRISDSKNSQEVLGISNQDRSLMSSTGVVLSLHFII